MTVVVKSRKHHNVFLEKCKAALTAAKYALIIVVLFCCVVTCMTFLMASVRIELSKPFPQPLPDGKDLVRSVFYSPRLQPNTHALYRMMRCPTVVAKPFNQRSSSHCMTVCRVHHVYPSL